MNNINATPTQKDLDLAKREKVSPATVAKNLLERCQMANVHGMTFVNLDLPSFLALSEEQKTALEQWVKTRFEDWVNNHIAPPLRGIIAKAEGVKPLPPVEPVHREEDGSPAPEQP